MAKLPSFDSQFEKTKAQAQRVQSLASALAETLGDLPDVASQSVFETETAQLAELHAAKASVETDVLNFTNTVATGTDDAYAAFDRVDEVGRLQSFLVSSDGPRHARSRLRGQERWRLRTACGPRFWRQPASMNWHWPTSKKLAHWFLPANRSLLPAWKSAVSLSPPWMRHGSVTRSLPLRSVP